VCCMSSLSSEYVYIVVTEHSLYISKLRWQPDIQVFHRTKKECKKRLSLQAARFVLSASCLHKSAQWCSSGSIPLLLKRLAHKAERYGSAMGDCTCVSC